MERIQFLINSERELDANNAWPDCLQLHSLVVRDLFAEKDICQLATTRCIPCEVHTISCNAFLQIRAEVLRALTSARSDITCPVSAPASA